MAKDYYISWGGGYTFGDMYKKWYEKHIKIPLSTNHCESDRGIKLFM